MPDQMGRVYTWSQPPQRIVSLVPSQSEYLWDLGLQNQLCGITKFCVHPEAMFRKVSRVGGTKELDLEKIRALQPDLIIGNKEENTKAQIEILEKEFKVWMSDVNTLNDAFDMMLALGTITDRTAEAQTLVEKLRNQLLPLKGMFSSTKVAYFIWHKPYMLAGAHTFVHHLLDYLGFVNVASHLNRYPEVSERNLQDLNPTLCLLSSEPFPFKDEHQLHLQSLLPQSKVLLADGEVFSWYGSRLLHLPSHVKWIKQEIDQIK